MKIIETAERVSQKDPSDNYVYQRSLVAYIEASKLVHGRVLEIGTGNGYGVEIIAPKADEFVTIDKFQTSIDLPHLSKSNVKFIQMNVPPLKDIPDGEFDFVITFQVIEHIKKDNILIKEIARVLNDKGKLIIATPNIKTSLTRNPWHVREYTVSEMERLLLADFQSVKKLGVFGNETVMEYYNENKKSVQKITKYDVLNLQYLLPRQLLQIPYDILNRLNRRKLLNNNQSLISKITHQDYYIKEADDNCFDLFYIAEKS